MAVAQAKQLALAAREAALPAPKASGSLGTAQEAARARLQDLGLPVKRDEYWRYTDPSRLTAATVQAAPVPADDGALFGEIDRVTLVFVDGVFDAAASDTPALAGVTIERLAEVGAQDRHWAGDFYGTLEARGQKPVERPLAALNSGHATDGVLIRATGQAAKPVSLVYIQNSGSSDAILHHCIKVEPGAQLTVLESGPGAARFNQVLEVDVQDGARFHHIRAQLNEPARQAATHIFARIGREASFKSFTLAADGRLTRNEAVLELAGADAAAHVAGALLCGAGTHHDDTVFITHDAPGCESRQVFKKVLKDGATGVFQGKILVTQVAQKTDGYQISQALLLDGDSNFLCKPELEIYADDVKCSHGSTSGAIDETALFYLQSRGVPKAVAQSLLVQAFLAEAIDEIEDEAIADAIRNRMESWSEYGER